MPRHEFPRSVRLAAWDRAAGRCEKCTAKLFPGKTHLDHIIADGLGGEPTLENCRVLCSACHGSKTAKHDVPAIAKTKRIRLNQLDGKPSRKPMPGSRASKWKRTFNHGTVRRDD